MIERYYSRMTLDFQTNKKIAEEVAIIPTKRLRNKIAGFATVSFYIPIIRSEILRFLFRSYVGAVIAALIY